MRNGSGTYSRVEGPYVYNTIIDQVAVNAELDDIATALTNSLTKNGETTATANQPMGTYRHTGVGNGVARTDYAAMGQVQDGTLNWVDGGGTADAITATYSPAITALVDGQICCVRATAANATTTPTFAPNGLTARTIVKTGGVALVAGDIVGDGHELLLRYLLASTRWELLNPAINAANARLAGSASQAFARLNDRTLVAEQATTSGTSIDFTGIPSWATKINVMFNGVSTNGNNPIWIQLGDSGGFETSGYLSHAAELVNAGAVAAGLYSDAFSIETSSSATQIRSGIAELQLQKSSTFCWVFKSIVAETASGIHKISSGRKLTSAALDRVRITTNGGIDTFDAGAISISYE